MMPAQVQPNAAGREKESMIREMRFEDCPAVAQFWRELLDVPAATDESVRSTFAKMSADERYRSFLAEEDGIVVGFITMVEVAHS